MNAPATNPPKPQKDRRRPARTTPGYTVVSPRGNRLHVRRPDGRPIRLRPNGNLLGAERINSVQSYLTVPAS
jgi:hypothetical protein